MDLWRCFGKIKARKWNRVMEIQFADTPTKRRAHRRRARRSDPVGRPHTWHSAKLEDNQSNLSMMQISQGMLGTPWHQAYHSSSSTSDLSSYDHGYLRRSPDQYSSRGSMENLDHTPNRYTHHPCHLSPAKSTNSIDQLAQLHSKRDSAYSSFSTNSSIPEYPAPAFYKERSYSMENVHSRGKPQEGGGMKQADIRYIKTVYNAQRGVSEEYEVKSSALLTNSEVHSKGHGSSRLHGYKKGSQTRSSSDSESQYVKGPPMPPTRSDSYVATRHHERPSSWSSVEQRKSCRTHSKTGWPHHSQGPPAPGQLQKPSFLEGQLHTVMEKSPETSPTMKPKQVYSQAAQPGQPLLPTGIYQVPSPEPHFAQFPHPSAGNSGGLYPALAKESGYAPTPAAPPGSAEKAPASRSHSDLDENGNQSISSKVAIFYQPDYAPLVAGKKKELGDGAEKFVLYRSHPRVYPASPSQDDAEPQYVTAPLIQESTRNAEHSAFTSHAWLSRLRDSDDSKANSHSQEYGPGGQLDSKNVNLQRSERDLTGVPMALYCKTKQHAAFSSLQNIPESSRLQNSLDLIEIQQGKSYPGTKWHLVSHSQVEKDGHGQIPEYWQGSDGHQDGSTSTEHIHDMEQKYRDLSSPLAPKTSDFSIYRLNSSSTPNSLASQYGKLDSWKTRCSVLEKVHQIEQHEQGSQWPQNLNNFGQNYGSNKPSFSNLEDIRNRRNSQDHAQLPGSRGGLGGTKSSDLNPSLQHPSDGESGKRERAPWHSAEQQVAAAAVGEAVPGRQSNSHSGHPENEMLKQPGQLQQGRGTFQLSEEHEREALGPPKAQHLNGSQLDTPFNRAYRNSIKDAQSRVLRATSFSRKDLNISPAFGKEPRRSVQRPTSAHVGMRSTAASPHTPKERHSITPTETKLDYTNKESVPGSQHIPRIGGRKRLTSEQKKRSYSEPEKMNEVGVSDSELSPFSLQKKGLQFVFPENTVADRRKIFERDSKGCSSINLSKPQLKQLQQNALADYIERKTGKRPSSATQDLGLLRESSQALYLQTGGQDGQSLSSASSINSLQDQNPHPQREFQERVPKTGRGFASLPPGLTSCFDLHALESKKKPQPSNHTISSSVPSWLKGDRRQDHRANPELTKSTQTDLDLCSQQCCDQQAPAKKPGKSASAEDLLDRSEGQAVAVHVRSRSSPTADKKTKDLLMVDSAAFTSFVKDPFFVVDAGTRSFGSKERNQMERSAFTHYHPHPLHHGEDVNNSSVVNETLKGPDLLRHLSRTSIHALPSSDTKALLSDSKQGTRLVIPSKFGWSSPDSPNSGQASSDGQVAGEDLATKWHPRIRKDDSNKACALASERATNLPEEPTEDATWRWKAAGPPRQLTSKIKWVRDDNPSQGSILPQTPVQKGFQRWQSLPSQSSSSSEPETPSSQGRLSLRISESCLQVSPLTFQREEDDDDVFFQPQAVNAPSEYSPPPMPPSPACPAVSASVVATSIEGYPGAPTTTLGDAAGGTSTSLRENGSQARNMESFPRGFTAWEKVGPNTAATKSHWAAPPPGPLCTSASKQSDAAAPTEAQLQPMAHQNSADEGPSIQFQGTIAISKMPEDQALSEGPPGNVKTPEDMKEEALAKEIIHQDKSLAEILDPDSKMKTTMDLMEGIFPRGCRENSKRKTMLKRTASTSALGDDRQDETKSVSCSTSSSVPELQNVIRDFPAEVGGDEEQTDINEKKAELMESLSHKLETLKEAKESLLADIKLNNALGEEVEAFISSLCKPNEFEKYRMFIGDLDKIVSLLLSLSGRLARVENILSNLREDADHQERNSLNEKRKMLAGQHEDARELKENLDRRERVVLDILQNYLSAEQLHNYQHFVKMKSALLIEQRELDDRIKLGQEQLKCLSESLPSDFLRSRKEADPPGTNTNKFPTPASLL